MKKRKIIAGLLIASAALGLASCADTNAPSKPDDNQQQTTTYTVTFNSVGGSNVASITVDANGKITLPTEPTKEGFTFAGWYVDQAYTTEFKATDAITANVTLYAKWTENADTPDTPVNPDTPTEKFTVSFDLGGKAEVAAVEDVTALPATLPTVDATQDYELAGWYTDAAFTTEAVPGATITADTTLYGKWEIRTHEIDSVEDLEAFRTLGTSTYAKYVLTADIDLEGVELAVSTVTLKGEFDGQGHTIRNGVYAGAAAKSGLLMSLLEGGIVKDVKFVGCSANSANECVGIVAGKMQGGLMTDIEINSCSVYTSNNYAGLLYGRSEGKNGEVNWENFLNNITVKNGSTSKCSQYGGFLVGDGTANITATNLDVEGEFESSANFGLLLGRNRGNQTFTVTNAVIDIKGPTISGKVYGLITQGNSSNVVQTLTNVYVKNAYAAINGSKGDITQTRTNCYYTNDTLSAAGLEGYTQVAETAVNAEWYKKLFTEFDTNWVVESDGGIKIKSSSPNVVSEGATVKSLKVGVAGATTRFKMGQEFSAAGLTVTATYSDDVQLIVDSSKYVVDSSAFDATTPGEYTITVKAAENEEITATYKVILVEQTGFKIYDEFMKHLFVAGNDFDATNLVVKSVWSDGKEETLAASEFKVDSSAYNKSVAGEYEIVVTNGDFQAQNITVTVVDTAPVVVDGKIYVNVDASSNKAEGTKVNGVETFTTLTNAIDYLAALGYDSDVIKVIYLADGKYEEKVTIPATLTNVKLIGESKEGTVLTYSAVESTVDIRNGSMYGLNCATLHVNATGFAAYNMSIRNDFDYATNQYNPNNDPTIVKESSPQGLALTINGDQAVINNVILYGNQDTLYVKSGRTYITKSLIKGNIDFIFGEEKGLMFFEDCEIQAINKAPAGKQEKNNGYVTAMKATTENKPDYGYIFNNCKFTDDGTLAEGSMSLGRPWGGAATVAMINCEFSKAYSTLAYDGKAKSRWYDMSGNLPQNADFAEFGSTGEGAITTAVNGGKVLTAEQAANYTVANIFAKENGKVSWSDAWNAVDANATLLTYKDKTEATGVVVSSETISVERNKTADLTAYVTPWNAEDKSYEVTIENEEILSYDGFVVKGLAEGTTTITFEDAEGNSKVVNVTVTAPTGLYTITFYDGETEMGTATGAEGDAIVFPTNTTKEGYQFVRYYSDAALTKVYTATTIPGADTKVYASYIDLNLENVAYVDTAQELIDAIAGNKVIHLTADIDFTGVTYNGYTGDYTSSLYGYDYAIKNWSATYAANKTAFFGRLYGGSIKNLAFKDCTVTTDATAVTQYVGVVAYGIYASEVLENISFTNVTLDGNGATYVSFFGDGNYGAHNEISDLTLKNITLNDCVVDEVAQYSGGLFARVNKGNIIVDGLYGTGITVNVTAASNNKNAGGLIGWVKDYNFTVKNADVAIKVVGGSSSQNMGGVVGGIQKNSGTETVTVENCKFTISSTEGGKVFGGVAGYQYAGTVLNVKDSTITLNVVASGESIGGVAGRAAGVLNVTNVTVTGSLGANYRSGSVVGYVNDAAAVVTLSNVLAENLTITNSNTDASGFEFIGKSDATATIDYTTCYYNNVVISLGGNTPTEKQGSQKAAE